MLVIHQEPQCWDCKNEPRVVQPDGTEATEKWVCNYYRSRIPYNILIKKDVCAHYIQFERVEQK